MNNAGIGYILPIDWAPMRIFKRTADVSLWGLIEMTKTFLPLVKMARGRVVNFASVGGKLYKGNTLCHVHGSTTLTSS